MKSKKISIGALLCSILFAFALILNVSPARAADEATIEASIEKGLAWLASVQDPVSGAWHLYITGWDEPCYDVSVTALVLLKFVDRAKELELDPFGGDYVYSANVIAGFDYLFTQAIVDGDRISFPCLETYNTSTAMLAVSACPDLSRTITTGPLAGQTYGQALQGMMNWMVYAQQRNITYACDEGGWNYSADPNDDWGWADQSNTGYATIGIGSSQNAGISIPPDVLTRLNTYITNVQDPVDGDNYDGGSWYEPCSLYKWVNILKTGNILYEMALVGDSVSAVRVDNALTYIEDHWNDIGQQPEFPSTSLGWMDSYQAMFAMMKGLEAFGIEMIDTDNDGDRDDDWFDEVSDVIVANQGTCNPGDLECFIWIDTTIFEGEESEVLRTAWALLTLERFIEPPTPVQVEKDYRYTNVCFERDNDGDGLFSEDPENYIIVNDIQVPIDDDGDGLYNEDDVDCPDGTDLGMTLPTDAEENFLVEAVLKNNGKILNYNPGQYYAVSTVTVLTDVALLTIDEVFENCTADTGISALNPPKGGGSVVIVEIGEDGVAKQIADAQSPNVTVQSNGDGVPVSATATLENVPGGTIILMYVKFAPGLQGETMPGVAMCENINSATANDGAEVSATANLVLVEK